MEILIHKATSRGYFNHGWLKTFHSFSFADYFNPERMNFGQLRVLNDDIIEAGKGFGMHPHKNMEIISIPIFGELAHHDSTGSKGTIKENQVQVMSAGRGIYHSEFNNSNTEPANFLQIWILPEKQNIEPKYVTLNIKPQLRQNRIHFFINSEFSADCVTINQKAKVGLADFNKEMIYNYRIEQANQGVYVFIIDGNIKLNNSVLNSRDAIGIWDTESFDIEINKEAKIVFFEVPMIN